MPECEDYGQSFFCCLCTTACNLKVQAVKGLQEFGCSFFGLVQKSNTQSMILNLPMIVRFMCRVLETRKPSSSVVFRQEEQMLQRVEGSGFGLGGLTRVYP